MTDLSAERRETGYPEDTGYAYAVRKFSPRWKQVSWGAILCGVVIALIVMWTLEVLGVAIGAAVIDPIGPGEVLDPALGPAAVIWLAAAVLLGLFAGGWVTGRLSPTGNHLNTIVHGLVMWGVTAILSLVFLTTTVGGVLSGLGRAVGQGTDFLTAGFVDTLPTVLAGTEFEEGALSAIDAELDALFDTDDTTERRLTLEDFRLSREITQYVTATEVDEARRQDVITAVALRTTLSEQEAAQTLDNWRATFQDTRGQLDETLREAADAVTDALAAVSGIIFAVLFIGGAAAGLGAYLAISTREDVPVEAEAATVETTTYTD